MLLLLNMLLHSKHLSDYTDEQLASDLKLVSDYLQETVTEIFVRANPETHEKVRRRLRQIVHLTQPSLDLFEED